MQEEEKREYEWTVISRTTITVFPRLGEAKEVVVTTYVGEGLPPHAVHIPKEEWSQELEDRRIAEDIHKRLAFKPETRRAPIPT